jgi:hypothetical protein
VNALHLSFLADTWCECRHIGTLRHRTEFQGRQNFNAVADLFRLLDRMWTATDDDRMLPPLRNLQALHQSWECAVVVNNRARLLQAYLPSAARSNFLSIRSSLLFFLVCRQAAATHCLRLLQQRVEENDKLAVHFVVSSVLPRMNLSKAELASAKAASSECHHQAAVPLHALDSTADSSGSSRGDSKQPQPAASSLRSASLDSVGLGLFAADKKGDEIQSPPTSRAFAKAGFECEHVVSSGVATAVRSETLTAASFSRERSDSDILAQSRQSRSPSSSVPAVGVGPGLVVGSTSKLASPSPSAFDSGPVAESVAARLLRQIAERHAEIRRLEEMNARDEALLLRAFD